MWKTVSVIWSESGGATQIFVYIIFLLSIVFLMLAWIANSSIITDFVASQVDIHAFNDERRRYLETLFCVMSMTMAQFYQYHISTAALYNKLSPTQKGLKNKLIHPILQSIMAVTSFCAGIVLFIFLFVTLFSFDMLERFEVNIVAVMAYYLPFLDLKWLVAYFVAMDMILLALIRNYLNNSDSSASTELELSQYQDGFSSSLFFGIIVLFLTIAIELSSTHLKNEYLFFNNISPYSIFDYLSILIVYTLQVGYLISNFREKHKLVNG
jgi:hypothetical protein